MFELTHAVSSVVQFRLTVVTQQNLHMFRKTFLNKLFKNRERSDKHHDEYFHVTIMNASFFIWIYNVTYLHKVLHKYGEGVKLYCIFSHTNLKSAACTHIHKTSFSKGQKRMAPILLAQQL